jgi:hypothetical protein
MLEWYKTKLHHFLKMNVSCHDIAEKLLTWRLTTITHSPLQRLFVDLPIVQIVYIFTCLNTKNAGSVKKNNSTYFIFYLSLVQAVSLFA